MRCSLFSLPLGHISGMWCLQTWHCALQHKAITPSNKQGQLVQANLRENKIKSRHEDEKKQIGQEPKRAKTRLFKPCRADNTWQGQFELECANMNTDGELARAPTSVNYRLGRIKKTTTNCREAFTIKYNLIVGAGPGYQQRVGLNESKRAKVCQCRATKS